METLESFTDTAAKNRNCLKDSSGSRGRVAACRCTSTHRVSWRNSRHCLKRVRSSAASSSASRLISCVLSGSGSSHRRHGKHISGTTPTQWQHRSVSFALSDERSNPPPPDHLFIAASTQPGQTCCFFSHHRRRTFVYSIAVSHLCIFERCCCCYYYYSSSHNTWQALQLLQVAAHLPSPALP